MITTTTSITTTITTTTITTTITTNRCDAKMVGATWCRRTTRSVRSGRRFCWSSTTGQAWDRYLKRSIIYQSYQSYFNHINHISIIAIIYQSRYRDINSRSLRTRVRRQPSLAPLMQIPSGEFFYIVIINNPTGCSLSESVYIQGVFFHWASP